MSLGFVTETEAQVESHLKGHLRQTSAGIHPYRDEMDRAAHDGGQLPALSTLLWLAIPVLM